MLFRRAAARWIVFAAALLTVSCIKDKRTDSDTTSSTASSTASGSAADSVERPAEIQLPTVGARTNLDSLRAYLSTFYHGELHTRNLPAICADTTLKDKCTASVTIQAIGLSKDIKADSGPARGRVIGEIKNLDAVRLTQMDSLEPASRATYYIYMDRARSGRARWNLLRVPSDTAGVIRRMPQTEVRACNDKPERVWASSDVDFSNCGLHAFIGMPKTNLLTAVGLIDFFERLERYVRGRAILPAVKWYGCTGGCCV